MDENKKPPLYKSVSGNLPEDIAQTLNGLYEEGYHLKELLPELSGTARMHGADDNEQTYTVLAVFIGKPA